MGCAEEANKMFWNTVVGQAMQAKNYVEGLPDDAPESAYPSGAYPDEVPSSRPSARRGRKGKKGPDGGGDGDRGR